MRLSDDGSSRNAFGFLRWLFAALVVVSHSAPLGGFAATDDPMVRWSQNRISFGTFAVLGFFTISGHLVTQSWMRTRDTGRFAWKRFLRIMPGYWVCLAVMVACIAPLAWVHQHGRLNGYLSAHPGPVGFAANNVLLVQRQPTIGDLFAHSPFVASGGDGGLNGSLWTLPYEVLCYGLLAMVAVLGLRRRAVAATAALSVVGWVGTVVAHLDPSSPLSNALRTPAAWPFLATFFTAALLTLRPSLLRPTLRWGGLALVLAVVALRSDLEWIVGVAALIPTVLWLGYTLPIRSFDKHGDLSYGTYIYAFPLQMLLAAYGVNRWGFVGYTVACLAVASVMAFLSWHLVEKRALRLKRIDLGRVAETLRRSPRARRRALRS